MSIKAGISIFISVFLPHIQDITELASVLMGSVNFVINCQAGNLLSFTSLLKTCFLRIDGKSFFFDERKKTFHKVTIFLINIVHAAKCHIISISGVLYSMTKRQTSKFLIQEITHCICKQWGSRSALREYIAFLLILNNLFAAKSWYNLCYILVKGKRSKLQSFANTTLWNRSEEIRQVQI